MCPTPTPAGTRSSSGRRAACGRLDQFANSLGSVGSVEDEVVGASFWVLVDGVEGAIEFILDSEVIQFIQHVLGVVRKVVQVLQQLFQRRVVYLHVEVSLKHGLHA